jgi:hypothetical protein
MPASPASRASRVCSPFMSGLLGTAVLSQRLRMPSAAALRATAQGGQERLAPGLLCILPACHSQDHPVHGGPLVRHNVFERRLAHNG